MHERLAWRDVLVLGAEARSTNVLLDEPVVLRRSLSWCLKPQGRTITTVHGRRVPAPDTQTKSRPRCVPRHGRRSVAM
jgi:hypothetical protein